VREYGGKISDDQAEASNHTTYQLLFASNRARHDMQMVVALLTTRVLAPDEDDWWKMKQVLKYLRGTGYLKLKLNADEVSFKVHWYIDG
jgi:hypothetical protein